MATRKNKNDDLPVEMGGDIEELPWNKDSPTMGEMAEDAERKALAEEAQMAAMEAGGGPASDTPRRVGIAPGEPGYDPPVPVSSGLANIGKGLSVAVPTSDLASEFGDVFEDIDDIPVSLTKFKVLKLAQGMSEAVSLHGTARPGDYLLDGHDSVREVVFMPVSYEQMRQLWVPNEEDENGRDMLQCKSQRRVMKRTEAPLYGDGNPGGPCAQCPLSMWTPGQGGKNRPPACTLYHVLIGVSLTHECRVEMHFKKSAEPQANEILNIIRTRGWGSAVFSLTQAPKQNAAKQTYWVPQANVINEVTPEMVSKGATIARLEKESMGY